MAMPPIRKRDGVKIMGKQARDRRLADHEAGAQGRNLRTSPQKLNLVAQSIRGKDVEAALAELTFSKRRIAGLVKKVLQSAIANAENNHDLDVDSLYVAEASVGKNMVMKRMRPRARGRMARILKPFSEIRIVVREREEAN
jgi:large subunit ribosomal protein L22